MIKNHQWAYRWRMDGSSNCKCGRKTHKYVRNLMLWILLWNPRSFHVHHNFSSSIVTFPSSSYCRCCCYWRKVSQSMWLECFCYKSLLHRSLLPSRWLLKRENFSRASHHDAMVAIKKKATQCCWLNYQTIKNKNHVCVFFF